MTYLPIELINRILILRPIHPTAKIIEDLKSSLSNRLLHRPKRKMRQNAVIICIFYNYVSSNLLNVPLLFSSLKY
jgi:hypothetical protein